MIILIVDDNANMRQFIKELLQKFNCEIIEASNGLKAIEMFLRHKPDLIFMDINMECMDGIEATGLIRRYSKTVKIVMVTDFQEQMLQDRALAAGANYFLQKNNLFDLKNFVS